MDGTRLKNNLNFNYGKYNILFEEYTTKGVLNMDDMFMFKRSKSEINEMCDSGMFNSIIEGYCIVAMKNAGFAEGEVEKLKFGCLFDEISAEEARKAKEKFDKGEF